MSAPTDSDGEPLYTKRLTNNSGIKMSVTGLLITCGYFTCACNQCGRLSYRPAAQYHHEYYDFCIQCSHKLDWSKRCLPP